MNHIKPVNLYNERNRLIGMVNPVTGELFNLTGDPARPTVGTITGGVRKSKKYAAMRLAADELGITMDETIAAMERSELTFSQSTPEQRKQNMLKNLLGAPPDVTVMRQQLDSLLG